MQSDSSNSFERQVLTRLEHSETIQQQIIGRLEHSETIQQQIIGSLDKLGRDIQALELKQLESNARIDAYQKASGQVVNLAFALISAATVTVSVSAVLGK